MVTDQGNKVGIPIWQKDLLIIHPLVLGEGHRFFSDKTPFTQFKLADILTTDAGAMLATYRQN